jgi:DNA-binding response OmpR family regulator
LPDLAAIGDVGGGSDDNDVVRILLVEDDPSIARSLSESLRESGFVVDHVSTGREAVRIAQTDGPELILLDLGLPDIDGYDVCRQVRSTSTVPIIVLTARGEELDRVLGLELGADDYVVKPFGFRELVARIRAVSRRVASEPDDTGGSDTLIAGPLRIDLRAHRATLLGEELAFTPKEFDLVAMLAEDLGAARSRTEIIEHVWDANWFGPTKTIDAHVAGIRKKLGDPRWVQAVRGVGFRLEVPE